MRNNMDYTTLQTFMDHLKWADGGSEAARKVVWKPRRAARRDARREVRRQGHTP